MKTTMLVLFVLLLSLASCKTELKETKKKYELILEDGIMVEKFDSTNVNQNRFTENNTTFTEGAAFTYTFEHLTSTQDTVYFTWLEDTNDYRFAWKFVPVDSLDENTIKQVKITVKPGLEPMITHIPDYNQTIIQYDYLTETGKAPFVGSSGVIENEANIWMHPPRDKYFRILELNPFPFIKAPYEIGTTWDWTLTIGSGWADERWHVWEGQIENQYVYTITEKKKIKTGVGQLECFVIESVATSRIGQTKLISFFHPEYGFVRLEYTNIDGSKTNLELSEYATVQ